MDDVFDTGHDPSSLPELEIVSRDWIRRTTEIKNAGEREGIIDAKEKLLQQDFDSGLNVGFSLICDLAAYRGRLMAKSCIGISSIEKKSIDLLIESICIFEADLKKNIRKYCLNDQFGDILKRKQVLISQAMSFLNF